MAPIQFATAISQEKVIQVNNYGDHQRDFTFIDDIASGTIQVMRHILPQTVNGLVKIPKHLLAAPHSSLQYWFGRPEQLMHFIQLLETSIGKKAIIEFRPKQAGDVDITYANTTLLETMVGYKPKVSLEEGILSL